jgi:hypothetical protein
MGRSVADSADRPSGHTGSADGPICSGQHRPAPTVGFSARGPSAPQSIQYGHRLTITAVTGQGEHGRIPFLAVWYRLSQNNTRIWYSRNQNVTSQLAWAGLSVKGTTFWAPEVCNEEVPVIVPTRLRSRYMQLCPYLTGNTSCLHYRAQPVNAVAVTLSTYVTVAFRSPERFSGTNFC